MSKHILVFFFTIQVNLNNDGLDLENYGNLLAASVKSAHDTCPITPEFQAPYDELVNYIEDFQTQIDVYASYVSSFPGSVLNFVVLQYYFHLVSVWTWTGKTTDASNLLNKWGTDIKVPFLFLKTRLKQLFTHFIATNYELGDTRIDQLLATKNDSVWVLYIAIAIRYEFFGSWIKNQKHFFFSNNVPSSLSSVWFYFD